MALAVKAVRGKGMSVRKAAAMYHVPKSSLHDVLTGKHEDDGEFYEKHKQSLNRRLFTDEEEAALASWFRERSSEGESVPMCEAQIYATDLLQAKHKNMGRVVPGPGRRFWENFFRRHPTVCSCILLLKLYQNAHTLNNYRSKQKSPRW